MVRGRKPAESCAPWGQLVTAFGWSNLKNFSQRRSRSEVCRVNYLGLGSKHLHLSVSVSGKQLPWKQLSPVRSGIVLRLSSNSWLLTHQIISKEAKLRVYSSNLQHKRVKVSLSMVIFEISVIISEWLWQCLTDFVKKNDRIIFLCQHTRSNIIHTVHWHCSALSFRKVCQNILCSRRLLSDYLEMRTQSLNTQNKR